MSYIDKVNFYLKNNINYEEYIKKKKYDEIIIDSLNKQNDVNKYYDIYCYDYILCILYMAQFRETRYIKLKHGNKFYNKYLDQTLYIGISNNIDFLLSNFMSNDRNEVRIIINKRNIDKLYIKSNFDYEKYICYQYKIFSVENIVSGNNIENIKHLPLTKRFDIFMKENDIFDDEKEIKLYIPFISNLEEINEEYVCRKKLLNKLKSNNVEIKFIEKSDHYLLCMYEKRN